LNYFTHYLSFTKPTAKPIVEKSITNKKDILYLMETNKVIIQPLSDIYEIPQGVLLHKLEDYRKYSEQFVLVHNVTVPIERLLKKVNKQSVLELHSIQKEN